MYGHKFKSISTDCSLRDNQIMIKLKRKNRIADKIRKQTGFACYDEHNYHQEKNLNYSFWSLGWKNFVSSGNYTSEWTNVTQASGSSSDKHLRAPICLHDGKQRSIVFQMTHNSTTLHLGKWTEHISDWMFHHFLLLKKKNPQSFLLEERQSRFQLAELNKRYVVPAMNWQLVLCFTPASPKDADIIYQFF